MGTAPIENEIKLRLESPAQGRAMLASAGFHVTRDRIFESNQLYDTPDRRLYAARSILRLRSAGDIYTLTWKGPASAGRHRAREEREVTVSNYNEMNFILGVTGFVPVFRYEKYRTEFRKQDSDIAVVLDETPVGVFLELEGKPESVDETAQRLGFSASDYITKSYGLLYTEHCAARGIPAANMAFE